MNALVPGVRRAAGRAGRDFNRHPKNAFLQLGLLSNECSLEAEPVE